MRARSNCRLFFPCRAAPSVPRKGVPVNVAQKVVALSAETEQRYGQRTGQRAAAESRIRSGEVWKADSQERFRSRLERLNIDYNQFEAYQQYQQSPLESAKPVLSAEENIALERILGRNDFLSVSFLEAGLRTARAVALIRIRGSVSGSGTGFMVTPRLLLTNNHVLPNVSTAANSHCVFDFEVDLDGTERPTERFRFAPDDLFITSKALDFTLVAVQTPNAAGRAAADWGALPLVAETGKVVIGEMVNIVQHPGGDYKQLALRENQLVDVLDNFLHYKTDTAPGSSGSPVFNDQWEVVALHHAGVPKRDSQGNLLTWHDSIWVPAMGEHQIAWVANEGIRVSRIVAHLEAARADLKPAAQALLDELLAVTDTPVAMTAGRNGSGTRLVDRGFRATPTAFVGPQAAPDPAALSDAAAAAVRSEALARLEQASTQPYYDADADRRRRNAYYAALLPAVDEAVTSFELTATDGRTVTIAIAPPLPVAVAESAPSFEALAELVADTHVEMVRYRPSLHVYPWVDLHPDGQLRSIYSGETFDPQAVIEMDFAVDEARAVRLAELRALDGPLGGEAALAAEIDLLESDMPYNCEHVVPQSWYDRREPMRGDLHHLFTCESGCNSFRGNTPYFDFVDFDEKDRTGCGRREGDKFEPVSGKGAIARAVLYFLVRYPGAIDDSAREFRRERLPILLDWHRAFPVTDYERHRNMAIDAVQGNRNPFIDFPAWADQLDFSTGFG